MGQVSVYQYRDARGVLLYVGITSQGLGRQLQHMAQSEWYRYYSTQSVEHYETREDAKVRETWLIKSERPIFNRQENGSWQERRAAYLTLFDPGRQSNWCDPKAACADDEPDCPWPNVKDADHYCGDADCATCHANYHGWSRGYPEGGDDALRGSAPSRKCGHCYRCDADEDCLVFGPIEDAEDARPCPECGERNCLYGVGHEDGGDKADGLARLALWDARELLQCVSEWESPIGAAVRTLLDGGAELVERFEEISDPDVERHGRCTPVIKVLFGPDKYRFNDPWDMSVDERAEKELECPF